MAKQGDQPTLQLYEELKRLYVWNKQPNAFQKLSLAEKVMDSLFKQEICLTKIQAEKYKSFLEAKYLQIIPPEPAYQSQIPRQVLKEFENQTSDHISAHNSFQNKHPHTNSSVLNNLDSR